MLGWPETLQEVARLAPYESHDALRAEVAKHRPSATTDSIISACRRHGVEWRPGDLVQNLGDTTKLDPSEWDDEPTQPDGRVPAHENAPEGYHVKGVSTLYGPDGSIRAQWIKTHREREDRIRSLLQAIEGLADVVDGPDPVPAPEHSAGDLVCVYPWGDAHIGMKASMDVAGQDWDLEIAQRHMLQAARALVELAPPAETALLVNVGDFTHSDDSTNRTRRSGHQLDVDGFRHEIIRAGLVIFIKTIEYLLAKHRRVHIINAAGNHDDDTSVALSAFLDLYFSKDPRVTIDTSAERYHWFRFGKNILGVTHGDGPKPAELPSIMAHDRKTDWGETDYRYWYTGHIHHETVKEYRGVIVESFRTLAPTDKYARAAGYRSGQDMRCDVLHRKHGRINRHIVGISQILEALDGV